MIRQVRNTEVATTGVDRYLLRILPSSQLKSSPMFRMTACAALLTTSLGCGDAFSRRPPTSKGTPNPGRSLRWSDADQDLKGRGLLPRRRRFFFPPRSDAFVSGSCSLEQSRPLKDWVGTTHVGRCFSPSVSGLVPRATNMNTDGSSTPLREECASPITRQERCHVWSRIPKSAAESLSDFEHGQDVRLLGG